MNERNLNVLLSLAMILLIVMAFLPLADIDWALRPYLFATGAMLAAVVRVLQRLTHRKDKKISIAVRRLYNIEFWSSLCYLVSAYFLFDAPYKSDWLAFLMAGAVLQVYTSFRIAYVQKKEAAKKP